jgi:F5/8 type C domain/Abnormal spindle-like microcephaly-assoc'd, ASPM-SPD-2-Hydin
MNLKGHAAALWRHRFRARQLVAPVALAVTVGLLGGVHADAAPAPRDVRADASATTPIWSTQLDFDNNGTAWSESYFAGLAADGLTTAELDMPWGTIEPEPGTFTFTEFDQELANASAAGIQLIPIFWQSGWGGSPAPWITDYEVGSGGAQGSAPTWWDPTEQSEYFTYVTDTIQNAAGLAGYGGSILDYGFLDAQWDLNGAGGGYAADDVSEFRDTYLPQTYGTIATFNSDNGTSYTAFSQVPAAAPGQALFGVFQAFRAWSVQQTYGQLTADVRAVTASTPLYYYYGGGFGNATNYANNPDTFFQLAKQYNVAVIDDSAGSQGLTLTFASLARAYGVRLAQEWTAPSDNSQLAAQAVQWISNYAMGLPEGGGEDFFIHDGTQKDTVGFPIYTSWLSTLKSLSGTYPQQPAAVYVDFSQGYGNTNGGNLNNVQNEIGNLWLNYQSGFAVVTSQEVNDGAVSLSDFKAVLPLNGVDANLSAYQSGGGTVLTQPEQLTNYTTAYAQIDSPDVGVLQTVPAVASNGTSASITLANITSGTTYDDPIAFSPAGLGLNAGSYYLVNAATGTAVPQTQQANGLLCASADIGPATLAQWKVVAGTPPSGTASSGCPVTGTGADSVSATAGQAGGGLQFLGVGQTNAGSDANLTQITQGGETAEETWTSAQSGAGDANVYLQLDPLSAVEAASAVTVQVTYWATPGQGFQVQYDTPGNAYQGGPTVTSPGTGAWTTASVQLTGAQFQEAQNGGADLRLNVSNASAPLIVQNVTISVTGGSSPSPTLSASPTSVSFGSQAVGTTSGTQAVTIRNSGSASATVSGVSASNGFSESNSCATIAANASCTVNVAFAPTTGGPATGTLTVTSNAADSPTTVALSGTGVSSTTNLALNQPATASSSNGSFGAANAVDGNSGSYWESSDGAAYPQTLTVDLGSAQSVGSVTLDLPPSSAWATRTETLSVLDSSTGSGFSQIVPSTGYTFNPATGNTVSFALPSGTNTRYVQLSFTGNTGWDAAQLSEFEIFPGSGGGSGGGSATLSASPTSLSFGSQTEGTTSAAKPVTISNTGSAAAAISSITAGSGFAETNTCGTSIAPGGSCTAQVTFSPTAATGYNANLTVSSNATNGTLTTALTGTGTATPTATLTASPTSVNLGSEAVGSTSAAQTVTISNTGSAAAAISSIGAPAPFAETSGCGSTLAPGASCTASVTFTPRAAGAASGTLTVGSNASDSSLTVALSGTGTSTGTSPVNLALNQPIVASSTASGYPATNADDGNTSSYWQGATGSWPTTLTTDLGVTDAFNSVTVDLPPSSAWSTRTQTLSVLGSDDDVNWTTLVGSATYTWNPATGNTVSIAVPSGTADRFVELDLTGNSVQNSAQVSEFEVFGPANPNLALNQPITASGSASGYPATNANDGNTSSYWEGTNGSWPTTLTANLGSARTIGSVVVDLPPSTAWSTRTQTLSVLGSTNGSSWTTLVASATYTWNPATGNTVSITLPAGTSDQYVQLAFTGNSVQNGAQVSEFEVFD